MKKRTKITIWVLSIPVIVLIVFTLLKIRQNEQTAAGSTLPDIAMEYVVKRTDIGDYLEVMGTVFAPSRTVYGRVSGEIVQMEVEDNQRIEKDATVAVVDDTEYELKYLQAKTAYENSIGQAPKTIEERQLSLQIAKDNLKNTLIRAPSRGFIKDVSYNEGDLISPNSIICNIVKDDEMYVESSIDEVDLKKVKTGQSVRFVFEPLDNLQLDGKIDEISPIAKSSGGIVVIPIKFSFDETPTDKGVIAGLTCSVNIILMENRNIIIVPKLAVEEDENGSFVLVKKQPDKDTTSQKSDNPPEKRYVKIGEITESHIEITQGLEESEIIVIKPDEDRAREVMKQLNPGFPGGSGSNPPRMGP